MSLDNLQGIMDHCVEGDGDCLIWVGSENTCGHPKVNDEPGRRAVWRFVHGAIPDRHLVTVTCGSVSCLNPDHLALTTKAEVTRKVSARPDYKLRKSAANARSARARLGKITMEIARHIRSSSKTGKELALELGVSRSLVSCVRTNKSWVEHSNPWAGLLR